MTDLLLTTDFPIKFPKECSILLIGSSFSGKTKMIIELLRHRRTLFEKKFDQIYYNCRYVNDDYNEIESIVPNVQLVEGFDEEFIGKVTRNPENLNILYIIDDLFLNAYKSDVVLNLFTSGRHRNVTVFLATQCAFPNSKQSVAILTNVNFILYFNCHSNSEVLGILNRKLFGQNKNFLQDAYAQEEAENKFAYLLICSRTNTPKFRVYSHIIPNQHQNVVAYSPAQ